MEYIIKMKDECVNDKATNTSTINKTLFTTIKKQDIEDAMRSIAFNIDMAAKNLPFLQYMDIMPVYVQNPIDPITGVSSIDVYYNKNNVRRHRSIYVEVRDRITNVNNIDKINKDSDQIKYEKIYEKK
jgi:hypothetical protein